MFCLPPPIGVECGPYKQTLEQDFFFVEVFGGALLPPPGKDTSLHSADPALQSLVTVAKGIWFRS